ncbi:MAG: Efflux ABC transporter, permease protein [Ktedonobacterales bacterium]|jgi:ABC-2 type transport system permease protein|nr:MAG: Efflux ABC transporter, permease protein [Ktedonobacterales bacterium]
MIQARSLSDLRGALRSMGAEANKGYAFVERGWYFTKRYWAWEVVWLIYNVVNALAVTFISTAFQGTIHLTQEQLNHIILYLAIGTAIWSYVSVVFDGVTETVTIERWEGTIEYTFMAPVSRLVHMLGICVFSLLHGFVLTALQLIVLGMFFHIDLSGADWSAAIVILAIGSVSLIGLGIVSAILPMLFTERGAQMAYIIRAVLLLVSGVYYPISVLPGWMQQISKVSPATYLLDGLRGSIQNGKGLASLWSDIWPLLICGAISVPLGLFIFNRAERYAKRTGKLKRNG